MNMFKKTGGFTLVELIVVIAILAILAGVAIPAYSGYIGKAQEAADLQVIGAVNTAIDAATATNDVHPSNVTLNGDKEVIVTFDDENVQNDYNLYMGANNKVVKYYVDVTYNNAEGVVEGVKPSK